MSKDRYSELDWLRVGLIFAVFLHHVFMPFNGDDWHVMNNDSSKLLDDIMVYFEQLRLPVLFFIAGAGSLILLQKTNPKSFLISKFHRLFIPLIVGMMLIVPPQSYFEHINDYDSLLQAYQRLLFSFESNHLWFIEFLIVFMVLAVPVSLFLRGNTEGVLIEKIEQLAVVKHGLFSLVILVLIIRCSLKLLFPSENHGIENLSVSVFYLLFFLAGMCFIKSPKIWQAAEENRRTNLKWLVVSSVIFYAYYFLPELRQYVSVQVRWMLWWSVCTLLSWSGLLVLLGYAIRYCKNTPAWLLSANELIYPFYILHQTIIVALAFYIIQWDAGIAVKSMSVLFGSFLVCAGICLFIIKPIGILRYLFGLKNKASAYKK